jgi:hypothetical protein
LKFYLSEKDIAVYHREKFRKKRIDPELIDFITPDGFATLCELRNSGIDCDLSEGLKKYKPKDSRWYSDTEHAESLEVRGTSTAYEWINPEVPVFAEHEWSDHHAPLDKKVEKTIWLGRYPRLLRIITCQGKNHDTNHLPTVMKFPTADAQYAALMHYHKMAGHIERPPAARAYRKVGADEIVRAYNMYQDGKGICEIAAALGRPEATIGRMPFYEAGRSHVALTKEEKRRIKLMRGSGMGLRQIARKLGRQASTIKYQVDRMKRREVN